jgi:DNA-binding MarR family transcriptional regulator
MNMSSKATMDQARNIFTAGKVIHDQILNIQSRYLASANSGPFKDLSVTQLHVIRVVRTHQALAMRELADLLGVSPPSASAMVDRLVDKGALIREHSTQDRRKVVVRISAKAIKHVEAVETAIMQLFVGLVEKIGPETAGQWCRVLERIKSVLSNETNGE